MVEMIKVDGRSYTPREYAHIQTVIAVTGSPPSYLANTPASQLPQPTNSPSVQQQEAIQRSAEIIVTEVQPTVVTAQSVQATSTTPIETLACFDDTTQFYELQIGYMGNPPQWLAGKILQIVAPICARLGWKLHNVIVNPATIDLKLEAPHNPLPIIIIYAVLALIGAAIAGAVIIAIQWRNVTDNTAETKQISDLSEVIQGIQNDPNIDQQTKNELLIGLNEAIGGVATHDQSADSLTGIKDLLILAIGASVVMSILK